MKKYLRQLEAGAVRVQEIAVVERLQAEIVELQIAFGLDRRGKAAQVETSDLRVQQIMLDAGRHISAEIIGMARGHLGLRRLIGLSVDEAQRLAAQLVEQQARARFRVVGIGLDQRARGEDRRQRQFVEADAVVKVALRLGEDRLGGDAGEAVAGSL